MVEPEHVQTVVRTSWHGGAGGWVPLVSGVDSITWQVDLGDRRCVVKAVPIDRRRQFEAELAAAECLAGSGIAAGAPVRAANGALCVSAGDVAVALLRHVPGRPLDRDNPLDQQWWGDTLGAAHQALRGFTHPALTRFHRLRPDLPHLAVEDSVRPAVGAAAEAMAKLSVTDQLSYGVLHDDPAPDAFRLDTATGRTGVIGWGACGPGPLMYDVASAVMHAGGPDEAVELLDGYVAAGPVPRDEIDSALATMLRFRYAVEVDQSARRLWTAERGGAVDRAENLADLHRARDGLTAGA